MKDDDFKLLRGFDNRRTDRRTDKQTFVNVESLLRLKIANLSTYLLYTFIMSTKFSPPISKTSVVSKEGEIEEMMA